MMLADRVSIDHSYFNCRFESFAIDSALVSNDDRIIGAVPMRAHFCHFKSTAKRDAVRIMNWKYDRVFQIAIAEEEQESVWGKK